MKKIAILLTTFSLLLTVWLLLDKEAEAGRNPLFTEEIVQMSPTPPRSQTEKPQVSPSPTPVCSPQPSPLSEEELNNRVRELSLEEYLDFGLGNADLDCDGIRNSKDNCIYIYNPDQKDSNGDGKGNACDLIRDDYSSMDSRCDEDGDGIPDFKDNCLRACNPDQKDVNKNGIGDVCDQAFPNAVLALSVCEKRRIIQVLKPQKISSRKKNQG